MTDEALIAIQGMYSFPVLLGIILGLLWWFVVLIFKKRRQSGAYNMDWLND